MSRGAAAVLCGTHAASSCCFVLKPQSKQVQSVLLKPALSDQLNAEPLCNHQFNSLALDGVRALRAVGVVCADEDKKSERETTFLTPSTHILQDSIPFLIFTPTTGFQVPLRRELQQVAVEISTC